MAQDATKPADAAGADDADKKKEKKKMTKAEKQKEEEMVRPRAASPHTVTGRRPGCPAAALGARHGYLSMLCSAPGRAIVISSPS
jgi:hypothetical protein